MIGCGGTMMMEKYAAADTMWVLIGAFMVFFMQPGFAMVETGFTRAKNAGNIVMKNFMDLCLGSIVFWIIGFGLMFGTDIGGLIGAPDFFVQNDYGASYPSWAFFIFQTVFCATAATIVSGAMAERTKFSVYCIYSILISAVIYPVSGHWIWGGGWLGAMGFHDFAGSTAVHMVGGVAALVGAKILGPRIGKYNADGSVNAIPGHSLTLGALGVFILWFGWFGFNGGSTVCATGDDVLTSMGRIFVTTNMAAASAATATMFLTWLRYGKPDVSMTLNGALAGLVAITAGCDAVSVPGAFVIGIIAVILSYLLAVPLGILMARKKDKLVDQLGTIYIVFIIAVPSLAYIFLFKAIGGKMGLPTTFDMDSKSKLMYILPIVSLALPQVANLMKWLRRYMIDQMNSDYVKFARSGGLTEGEIFTKHILKNAAIPIVQGVPASVLFALTGAIITERVYVVPGAGNLLTEAISKYDNGVIVGVTLFYAVLSVISIILGDVLMSMVDPRISFSTKDR